MRLLDTTTLKLVDFYNDDDLPQYVILSHTWGSQEVSLQDFLNPHSKLEQRDGYQKIKSCCEKAWNTLGIRYCWIDTCCIDKSSSAELSEAINSMFKWYSKAIICYAYLSDVESKSPADDKFEEELSRSRWFTRGWTLQELLAPSEVLFFNSNWVELGSKGTLMTKISQITGVDEDTLVHPAVLFTASVAHRMSWAASRETTRLEDIAYCLMGIFNVNMPLLYGEGERAFIRLQEEIIRESNDFSILVWDTEMANNVDGWHTLGILARHPSQFKGAGGIQLLPDEDNTMIMTNRGLQVQLRIVEQGGGNLAAIVNCLPPFSDNPDLDLTYQMAVPLRSTALGDGSFGRRPHASIELVPDLHIRYGRLHTLHLCKGHTSISETTKSLPMDVLILGSRKAGVVLCNAVHVTKPITDFTVYQKWQPSWSLTGEHSMRARFEPPPGRSDWIAVLHFVHVVDTTEGFAVIAESRRLRGQRHMHIVPCAKHAEIDRLIQNYIRETGRRNIQDELRDGLVCGGKRFSAEVKFQRVGDWIQNGRRVGAPKLTVHQAKFEVTNTQLTVRLFRQREEHDEVFYELESRSTKAAEMAHASNLNLLGREVLHLPW